VVKLSSLILSPLLIVTSLFAPIHEYYEISELLNHLDEAKAAKTLILFDVDNTLIEPHGIIGSDQWFAHMMEKNAHLPYLDAASRIVPLYHAIRNKVPVKLVEEESTAIIQYAQDRGFMVIGLTVQREEISATTLELLRQLTIDFSVSSPLGTTRFLELGQQSLHKDGVVFCCGNHDKGQVLIAFLKECNFFPDHVIFVDDKLKALESVEQALKEYLPATSFTGIRYGHVDHKAVSFDAAAAEKELEEFLQTHPHVREHAQRCGG